MNMTTGQRRRLRRTIPILLCLCFALPRPVAAKRLAVLEIGGDGSLEDAQLAFLADEVRSAALDALDRAEWTVITRENMLVLMEANAVDLAACEGQCEVETGQLIGADVVVAGDMVKMGSQFRVRLKVYDTANGQLIASEKVESEEVDGVVDQISGACARLFGPLPGARRKTASAQEDAFIDGGGEDWSMESTSQHVVYFETVPDGAEVSVDDQYVCDTPCSKALVEGSHDVSLVLPRYEIAEESVRVDGPETVQKVLRPKFGWLSVETTPTDIPIAVDGEVVGRSPLSQLELPPGSHEVKIEDPSWVPDGQRITVEQALVARIELTARPRIGGLEVGAQDADGNDVAQPVYVDDEEVGVTPWAGEVQVGAHDVRVGSWRGQVNVREGEVTTEHVRLGASGGGRDVARGSLGGPGSEQSPGSASVPASPKRRPAPLPSGAQFAVGPYFAPLGGNPLNAELVVGGSVGVRIDGLHILEADIQVMPRSGGNQKDVSRAILALSEEYLLESLDPALTAMFRYRPTVLFGCLPGTDAWFGLELAASVGLAYTEVELLEIDWEAGEASAYDDGGGPARYANPMLAFGLGLGLKARLAAGVFLRFDFGATFGIDQTLDFGDPSSADTNQTLIGGSNPNPLLNRLDCDNNSGAACTMGYELLVYRIGFGVDFCLPAGREGR